MVQLLYVFKFAQLSLTGLHNARLNDPKLFSI